MHAPAFNIVIARLGSSMAAGGTTAQMGMSDLRGLVSSYDGTGERAPITIGEPKLDSPAWGWVSSLTLNGSSVVATVVDVAPAFASARSSGRFSKYSASLYRPNSPFNPVPGRHYLKHVSFIGEALPSPMLDIKPALRPTRAAATPAEAGTAEVVKQDFVVLPDMPVGYRATTDDAELYRRALALQAGNPRIAITEAARVAQEEMQAAARSIAPGVKNEDGGALERRAKQIQLINPGQPWIVAYSAARDEAEAVALAARNPSDPNLKLNVRAKQLQSRNLDLSYSAAFQQARSQINADQAPSFI